jgi:DNA polymerase III epsilon subunit-like protein
MIVIDIETTGINPEKCSIVSIGAIDFNNPSNQFYEECQIFEGADVLDIALDINGFTHENIRDPSKMTQEKIIKEFIGWVDSTGQKVFGGHNHAHFDMIFLSKMAVRNGMEFRLRRGVDLHSVCFAHQLGRGLQPYSEDKGSSLNLNAVLNYVGLPNEPEPHTALTGAKVEAEALCRIIHGKCLLKEYENYKIPDYLLKINRN